MFYIQPPKGLVLFHTLEEIVFSRLEYLNMLDNDKDNNFNGKFEYLLEGSPYDCVGHFTLRLLTSRFTDSFSYWINKETLLLNRRLSLIQPKQLYKIFRTVLRHIKRRGESSNPVDIILFEFSSFYLIPKVFKHIVAKSHSKDCTEYHQKIDFELVPDLIESRSVELCGGFAVVYCSQWKEVLQSLFQTFITFEIKSQSEILEQFLIDPRINSIRQKLQSHFYTKGCSYGKVAASNIDDEVFNFPPCMEHLHFELRRKHRLSHYARFYYTLFLKECGMSMEDSLTYWSHEYSKPHTCTSLCTHDWQTDAKKFIYSIRHMYGLEGGRKNYKTPNCSAICDQVPGTNYEGGCPFSNFDTDSLRSLLSKSMTETELHKFMINSLNQKPQDTCAKFFRLKNNAHVNDVTITTPVQYYMTMTELNQLK